MSLGDGPSHEYRIYPRNYRFRSRIRTRYSLLCLSALLCTCCNVYTIVPPRWFFFFLSLFIRRYTVIDTRTHQYIHVYTYGLQYIHTYIYIYERWLGMCAPPPHYRRHVRPSPVKQSPTIYHVIYDMFCIYIYIFIFVSAYTHTYTHTHIFFVHTLVHAYIYIYISHHLCHILKNTSVIINEHTFK